MKGWRLTVAALVVALPTACSVKLSRESGGDFARNECKSDSECGAGQCQSGACVAHKGAFSTLLLAIAPPLSAAGVGGVRTLLVKTEFDQSNEDTKIDLSPTTVVHGFVSAPPGCGVNSTSAAPTFRAQVTLTPREESYGLPTVTYVARTSSAILSAGNPCVGTEKGQVALNTSVDEFVVALPGATISSYDVYVEPLPGTNGTNESDGGAPGSCQMVPQLFRNVSAGGCLNLVQGKPQTLDVVIPWPKIATGSASLDGWTLDVVQPISGQVISDRLVLVASDRTKAPAAPGYEVGCATCRAFHYARGAVNAGVAVAGDEPGKELVRLSPPEHTVGPVIQAELSGLEATDATRAVFPALGPFPAAVLLDAVVNERDSSGSVPAPVPGDVTLTATELYGIKPGIFASFSTTGVVGTDGSLSASVLPGTYRARVVPQIGLGFAASESTLDIACEHDPNVADGCLLAADSANPPVRGGLVLRVPPAAQISGNVVDAVARAPIDRASVQAGPAAFGVRQCPKGVDASVCAAEALGVLDLSLGEDAFVPRSVSTVTDRGTFTLNEVDCGGCSQGSDVDAAGLGPGAVFDISVRPPDGSRFPWLLRPGVTVDGGSVPLGQLSLPLPIIHRGTVEIAQDKGALPVSSALISAYVMRDEHGAVIDKFEGLSSCAMGSASPSSRCIRSVLKVAETIAAQDGTFELVVPAAIP